MMKKLFGLFMAMGVCTSLMAQWTKPAAPASMPLTVGEECYLYNIGADAFFLGANDWSTRGSVSKTRGYKVYIEKYESETVAWDGESYYLTSYIEDGSPKGQVLCTFISGWDNIWVDRAKTDPEDKAFTFQQQADGTYRIGMSNQNTTFTLEVYSDAWIGLIPSKADTRLYLCEEYSTAYDFSTCQLSWIFVKPADYEAYLAKSKQYDAALALGALIDDAKTRFPSLDISSAESVYQNTASTADELDAARAALISLMEDNASPSAMADVTNKYITNPSYDNNNNDGWSGTTPGFQQYGNAEFFNKNYDYHQALKVREGVYRLSLTGYYRAGSADKDAEALAALEGGESAPQNALLYAKNDLQGELTAPLPFVSVGATTEALSEGCVGNSYGNVPNSMMSGAVYMAANKYPATSLICMVGTDGALTIGLKKTAQIGDDWTLWDDWKLEYVGNSTEAYDYLRAQYLSGMTDYQELVEGGEITAYDHAAYAAYLAAKQALNSAASAADISAALATLVTTSENLGKSIEAYKLYQAKYEEAVAFVEEKSEQFMGEGMEVLSDYVQSDEAPSDEYPLFKNGGALYILDNGPLNAEEIAAETAFLQQLMDDAIASGMADGTDCTSLIKNPHFEEAGGWTKEGLPEWPLGTETYKLAQGYTILFNVYQTFSGLQNGLYELNLNDFFRPANSGEYSVDDNYRAYVYMNGYEKKMNLIDDGKTDAPLASDDVMIYDQSGYVPNSVEGAALAFENGRYTQKIFGLVTDGTLKIGVRNDLRYEGCWGVWSDFKLIFRAKNPEVLAEVLQASLPQAKEMLQNKCGAEEISALQAAIAAAEGEPEDAYDALVALKLAMDAVTASTDNYALLHTAIANAEQTLNDYAETGSASALQTLTSLTEQAKAAYDANSYNAEQVAQTVVDLNAAVVAVKIPSGGGEEQDVSSLIVNNTFDPARGDKSAGTIEGWTTSAMNGYKENTVSYNRAGITLNQTLNGLPKGKYKVTVHTYYRAGYADADYALWQEDPAKSHLTTLYAQTSADRFEKPIMNLCEDAQPEQVGGSKCDQLSNGLYVPNGTSATVTWFNAGYYLNELEFTVPEDGNVTIGLEKTEVLPDDYEVVGAWHLYYYGDEDEPTVTDYTSVIVNPTFDPAKGDKSTGVIEGWTTSAMNGYKENTVSYNRAGITLYQTLNGLPAGEYEVTVHTYYRAGYADADFALWQEDPAKSHLTTLYAQTSEERFEKPIMNLCEDAQPEQVGGSKCDQLSNGLYVPNGTSSTVTWFNAGYYLNSLKFTVPKDGTVTIGLEKTEVLPDDYEVVGAWHLYYYGKTDVIEVLQNNAVTTSVPAGIYGIDGSVRHELQKGINIVKMKDGSVKKVVIR